MSDVITVNASGLSCPQPVLMTKKALVLCERVMFREKGE